MNDRTTAGRLAIAGLAQLVLAVATGLPLRSTDRLVPRSEDPTGPFVGI